MYVLDACLSSSQGKVLIINKESYTFDDLLIKPQYSEIASRSDVDVSVQIGPLKLKVPVIAANMDTVCGIRMAEQMGLLGGLGILHRFAPVGEQFEWVQHLKSMKLQAVPSVGVDAEALDSALLFMRYGADAVCVDVAHGNCKAVLDLNERLLYWGVPTILGNFAGTPSFLHKNVIAYKVGVGPGSACETRVVAGVGLSQATAISEMAHLPIIADGGIRKPADFAKAIGLGAEAVMVGGYFAGTDEVPERGRKTFRGMASKEAQLEHRGRVSNSIAEGASFEVESRGPVADRVAQLVGGLRSAMSYTGARNIAEFQAKVIFRRVSNATMSENVAHFGDMSK